MATELLKSRQRSGQRGYVDVETEGQPTEEPPADTRLDVSQILGAELLDTTMPEAAESGPETRPRQPESEPGSEPVDRKVRPRLASDQQVTQLDEVENSQSTVQARGDVGQAPDGTHVDNPPDAQHSSTPSPYPLISASNYVTVLPVENEFDSKAQAVVHGSADAVIGQTRRPLRQLKEWPCLMTKHELSGKRPDPKTKVVWCMMSCRYRTRKNRRIQIQGNRQLVEIERSQCHVSRGK